MLVCIFAAGFLKGQSCVEEHRTVRTICLQACRRFSEIDANKEGDLNASIGMPYAPSIWSYLFLVTAFCYAKCKIDIFSKFAAIALVSFREKRYTDRKRPFGRERTC